MNIPSSHFTQEFGEQQARILLTYALYTSIVCLYSIATTSTSECFAVGAPSYHTISKFLILYSNEMLLVRIAPFGDFQSI